MGRSLPRYQDTHTRRPEAPPFQGPSAVDIHKIIVDGDIYSLIDWADKVGRALANQRLSTSQIRNVFGAVRQIQLRWDKAHSPTERQAFRDAMLLLPKLGYYAERDKRARGSGTTGMETLQRVLEPALRLVGDGGEPQWERYERFVEFFEAIVAYHKKHGGI